MKLNGILQIISKIKAKSLDACTNNYWAKTFSRIHPVVNKYGEKIINWENCDLHLSINVQVNLTHLKDNLTDFFSSSLNFGYWYRSKLCQDELNLGKDINLSRSDVLSWHTQVPGEHRVNKFQSQPDWFWKLFVFNLILDISRLRGIRIIDFGTPQWGRTGLEIPEAMTSRRSGVDHKSTNGRRLDKIIIINKRSRHTYERNNGGQQ